jgi:hypothetical protein
MKVRDLVKMPDMDLDVCTDMTDDEISAFVSCELTEEGERHFAEVLDCDCEITEDQSYVIVSVGDSLPLNRKVRIFFNSMAGYCSCSNWDKWFKSEEEST